MQMSRETQNRTFLFCIVLIYATVLLWPGLVRILVHLDEVASGSQSALMDGNATLLVEPVQPPAEGGAAGGAAAGAEADSTLYKFKNIVSAQLITANVNMKRHRFTMTRVKSC